MSGGFVRAARGSDADGLAVVQVESWRAAFAALVPEEVISELTSESAVAQWASRWREAISAPPTSTHRVHVAVAKPGDPEILRLDFLKAAGWAPDGSRSNLDMGVKVAVERLHTRVGSAGG
jgi:hypothetical protein